MVPILVLLTIAACIFVTWLLEQHRDRVRAAAKASAAGATGDGLVFHPGHTWVRFTPDGLATIGTSDFAAAFAGKLVRVRMPREGSRVRQGEPAWTLRSERGHDLTQVMPISGKVLAVNDDVYREPRRVQSAPYGAGWLLRVRPGRHPGLGSLLHDGAADLWRDATRLRVANRFSPAAGASAYDGGEWSADFGDRIDDAAWDATRRELFPDADPARVS